MRVPVRPWCCAVVSAVVLWGCSSSEPGEPSPQGDAGSTTGAWDGGAVPLEELGDEVDAGTPSACRARPDAGPDVACGDLEWFDLGGCDLASLERLPASGHFMGISGSVALGAEGTGDFLNGFPVEETRRDARTLFLSTRYAGSGGRQNRVSFAACEAPHPGLVKGCTVTCRDGTFRFLESGDLHRMTWRDGEAESSGNVHLVSESFVERGQPVDVYVTHGHAYVVSVDVPHGEGGLTVFDVSDPAHPVRRAVIHLEGDSFWNGVWSKGDALYVASNTRGLLVFDISNPASPQFLRSLPDGGAIDVHTVTVDGDMLYAMSPGPNRETLFFDISTPTAPKLLQRFVVTGTDVPEFAFPHDAFAYQGRLYVNHYGDGYVVLDVSDPAAPRELGAYRFPFSASHANAVGTFAGRTIAFEGGETFGAHLRVLDVTDPARIVKIGAYQLRPWLSIHNMVLRGQRLYVAYYQEGLRVLDVANPTRPTELAYFNTFRETDPNRTGSLLEGAIGIRVPGDGHIYVVDTSRGLLIFNEP